MWIVNKPLCHAVLPFLVATAFATSANAIDAAKAMSVQNAELLVGGVGEREREQLLEQASEYDLFISFAGRESGAYLSQVNVTISGPALEQPIEITTNGPLLLANLPDGRYAVSAELPGWKPRERHIDIERGEHRSVWITFVPDAETGASE